MKSPTEYEAIRRLSERERPQPRKVISDKKHAVRVVRYEDERKPLSFWEFVRQQMEKEDSCEQ